MKTTIYFLLALPLLYASCSEKKSLVERDFDFAARQLTHAIAETDAEIAAEISRSETGETLKVTPRTIGKKGELILSTSREWTSGFFPGELWYMYEYTGDPEWERQARRFTDPLEREKTNGVTHDMGFKVYCSFGNGYRLTGDPRYKEIMLKSAYTLITRYSPIVKSIRSWDHNRDKWEYPVIIDNLMNLELLFWAFRQSSDSTFYRIAVDHAETTMKNHFRPDYSTYHVIDYYPETGEVRKRNTHQGYAHESTWSRGEGWALYGYTMIYRETNQTDFLDQARQVAKFIFTHPNLPGDLIPYWDFNAPEIPNEPRDVSAATVTASALYELSTYVSGEEAAQYKKWADAILQNLSDHYLAKYQEDYGFLLLHSTGSKPGNTEVDVPLVYADYYFLEALLRKQKIEETGKLF